MAEVVSVMLDNTLQSQNDDYSCNRMGSQVEFVESLMSKVFEKDSESKMGIFTIAHKENFDVLTLTSDKRLIYNHLNGLNLSNNCKVKLTFFNLKHSMIPSELSTKTVIIFLSSSIWQESDTLHYFIELLGLGFDINVICFGDAYDYAETLKTIATEQNFKVVAIKQDEDFKSKVFSAVNMSGDDDDDLQKAIQRSLVEK